MYPFFGTLSIEIEFTTTFDPQITGDSCKEQVNS